MKELTIKGIKELNPTGIYQVLVDTDARDRIQILHDKLQGLLPKATIIITPEELKLEEISILELNKILEKQGFHIKGKGDGTIELVSHDTKVQEVRGNNSP